MSPSLDSSVTLSQNQTKSKIVRVTNHPILSFGLVLVLLTMALYWYRAHQPPKLPDFRSYQWSQHPKTLLMAYPTKDCGCGGGPEAIVSDALSSGLDVLVISPTLSSNLKSLQRSGFPPQRFKVISDVNSKVVAQFTPSDKQRGFALIRNGRLVEQFYTSKRLEEMKQSDVLR